MKTNPSPQQLALDVNNWQVLSKAGKYVEYFVGGFQFYIRWYKNGKFMYQDGSTDDSGWTGSESSPHRREVWHRLEVASFRDAVKAVMVIERMEQT